MARKARFRKDPDPRFWALNRSLEFDWRLAPYDIDQSRAHARGLNGIGVLDDAELQRVVAGLDRVEARMGEHGFAFEDADEDIHMAVERLLGQAAGKVSMSSTKSSTGHLLGAAGSVEAIFSILAIRDNVAPPTINLDNPSVETAIDLVPQKPRQREINVALSNSFGFGGTNASLVIQRAAN